jgi:hypothetical protein
MDEPNASDERRRGSAPGDETNVAYEPSDDMVESEPLDLGEGDTNTVIRQENVGPGSELGGGEYPDRDTPPSGAAAGSSQPQDPDAPGDGVLDPSSDDPPEPNEPG